MRVLITGASGFVGAHTTGAVTAAGHDVRAFVRTPSKLDRALEPLETVPAEVVVGDVLDAAAVADAAAGCEAVVNCANIYSLSTRNRNEIHRVNVAGTENVLASAVAAGCSRVVHVSTYLALLPSDSPVAADPPIGARSGLDYHDSKIAAEEVARRYQDEGAPVTTVYPGQVFGPDDPGAGEMVNLTQLLLGSPAPPGLKGSLGIVDVRWLARLHARLLDATTSVRRVLAPGTIVTWKQFGNELRSVAGRPFPRYLPTPNAVAGVIGSAGQAVSRLTKREVRVNPTGPWILSNWQTGDDSFARRLAGEMPPLSETFADSVRSMAAGGQISAKAAGVLAP